jgi:hypothetical protein
VPVDAEANLTRIKLAGAWTTLIALYIYADFLSLYRPEQLEEIGRGRLGPFEVSQGTLVMASLIVMIPAAMILLSLVVAPAVARSANLVLAVVYTVVNVVNLIGEFGWAYYILFGLAEIAVTILIFFVAWRWRVLTG